MKTRMFSKMLILLFIICSVSCSGDVFESAIEINESSSNLPFYSLDSEALPLEAVLISSNNANSSLAMVGDVITLSIIPGEALKEPPTVTIANQSASVTGLSINGEYSAVYTMQSGDTEGVVPFHITFQDAAGNAGTQVTATTDSSSVTFDKTAPALTVVTISSDYTESSFAYASNVVTLSFSVDEELISEPTVTIADTSVSVTGSGPYTSEYTVQGTDAGGTIPFSIDFTDSAGNAGTQVMSTTDSSSVIHDDTTVQFSSTNSSGIESDTAVNLVVTRTPVTNYPSSVAFSIDGSSTATEGIDYDYTLDSTSPIIIPANESSANITITVVNDPYDEDDSAPETIIANLSGPNVSGNTTHTYSITDDDDPPNVSFSESTSNIINESTSVNISFSLSMASMETVNVNIDVDGSSTAIDPDDYSISGDGAVIFNPGQTSKTVTITPVDDILDYNDLNEDDTETIILNITTPNNATLGAITTHTSTIIDDDGSRRLAVLDSSVTEGDSGTTNATITVVLSGPMIVSGSIEVGYTTQNGTAQEGSDYDLTCSLSTCGSPEPKLTWTSIGIQTFTVPIIGDTVAELSETVYINLSEAADNSAPPPAQTLEIIDASGTLTINNNDPSLTISSAETMDIEGNQADGYIDHYRITFSESVTDSTFDGYSENNVGSITARWQVAGYSNVRLVHGSALPSMAGTDTANDNVIYIKFDQGSNVDTGQTPELTAVAATIQSAGGNGMLYYNSGNISISAIAEQDGAGPIIYYALADGAGAEEDGNAAEGDSLKIRYTESTSAPSLTGVDLDTIISLNNGHSLGSASDITSAVWSSAFYSNDTLTIIFATNNPDVDEGDEIKAVGSTIKDLNSNNPVNTAYVLSPPVISGSFDDPANLGPRIVSSLYYDTDSNGRIDHIRLEFDKNVDDSTFPGYTATPTNGIHDITTDWLVAGYNDVALDTNSPIAGEANPADDSILWLKFAEGADYNTGAKPDLTTASPPQDVDQVLTGTNGCYLNVNDTLNCGDRSYAVLTTTDAAEEDSAPPIIIKATAKIDEKYIYIKFSENVWGLQDTPACGSGGELKTADFTYTDNNSGSGATIISSVATIDNCGATDAFVKLITDIALIPGDIATDQISASSNEIYDAADNAANTSQATIYSTTSPYVKLANSYYNPSTFQYFFRVVFSEPMDYTTATTAANYALEEESDPGSCGDFDTTTPLSVVAVSSTVFDLESPAQCDTTMYRITASNVLNIDQIEAVSTPNVATTYGSSSSDSTPPRIIQAISLNLNQILITYSEPMKTGDQNGSAECSDSFITHINCGDTLASGNTLYTIIPGLGNITSVTATSDISTFIITHTDSQYGAYYTLTVDSDLAEVTTPEDLIGNDIEGQPSNQATLQGGGAPIADMDDGPLFSDPFADGTSFSFAFVYSDRLYLGPNDTNSGTFRFEADGSNPLAVSFLTGGAYPGFTTFGYLGDDGPNFEDGISSFQAISAVDAGDAELKEYLFVGPINTNPKLNEIWFTTDIDDNLDFFDCSLGTSSGMVAVEVIYGYGDFVWIAVPGPISGGSKVPVIRKFSIDSATCTSIGANDWNNNTQNICPIGDTYNSASYAGIDSMIVFENKLFIGNNGGVACATHDDNASPDPLPTANSPWTAVINETSCNSGPTVPTNWNNYTLAINKLQKIPPGERGMPFLLEYNGILLLVRNVTTTINTSTREGGELWKCSGSCDNSANWSRIFSSVSGQGSDTGIEDTDNVAVSMIIENAGYLYIGIDNMNDGMRVYRTSAAPADLDSYDDFTETGRVADAGCANHSSDTGATGGFCYGYQILSAATLYKQGYDYLYITTGCTIDETDGGICDYDGSGGNGFTAPPIRVLITKD